MDYFLSSNRLGVYVEGKPLIDNSYFKINLNNNIIPIYDLFKQNKTGFLESKYSVNFVIGLNLIEFRYFDERYGNQYGNIVVDEIKVEEKNSTIILKNCIIFLSTNTITVDGSPLQEIYQGYLQDIVFQFSDIEDVVLQERVVDNLSLSSLTDLLPTRLFYGSNLSLTDGDTISIVFDLNKTKHPVIINDVFKKHPNYIYTFYKYSEYKDLNEYDEEYDPNKHKYVGILSTNDKSELHNIKKYTVYSIKDYKSPKSIRVLYLDTMETSPFGDKGYNGTYGNMAKDLTSEFIKENVTFFNFTNEPLKDTYGRFLLDLFYGDKVKENILSYNLILNGLLTPSYSSSNELYSQRYNDYIHELMLYLNQNRLGIWQYLSEDQTFTEELNTNINTMHDLEEGNDTGKILWVKGNNPKDDYHEKYFYYLAYSMNIQNGNYTIDGSIFNLQKLFIFIPKYIKENRNYEYNIIRDKILLLKDGELKVYGEIRFSIEYNFYYIIVYNTLQVV